MVTDVDKGVDKDVNRAGMHYGTMRSSDPNADAELTSSNYPFKTADNNSKLRVVLSALQQFLWPSGYDHPLQLTLR